MARTLLSVAAMKLRFAIAVAITSFFFAGSASAKTVCRTRFDVDEGSVVRSCETYNLACPACEVGALAPALATLPLTFIGAAESIVGGDPRRWHKPLLIPYAALGAVQTVSSVALIIANMNGDLAGAATWGGVGLALGVPAVVWGTWGILRPDKRGTVWPFETFFYPALASTSSATTIAIGASGRF